MQVNKYELALFMMIHSICILKLQRLRKIHTTFGKKKILNYF